MLRTLMLSTLLFWGANVRAQEDGRVEISKGSKFIAGSFAVGYSTVVNQSVVNSFLLQPTFGSYFRNNVYWGTAVSYNYYKSKDQNNGYYNTTQNIGLSLLMGKDFKISRNFFFELQPELSGYRYIGKVSDGQTVSTNSLFAGVNGGLLFFFNDRFALRNWFGALGYSTSFNDDHHAGLSFSSGALNFTFLYYFK